MIASPLLDQARPYLEARRASYIELLRQMVVLNSFTANPAGVNALGELTAAAFGELGFSAEAVQSINPSFGRHLVLRRQGSGGPTIGLVSHLDTVFPAEEEARNGFCWRPQGERLYGPGTVDIKGGTVLIYMLLDALRHVAPELYASTTWVVLLNASEEALGDDFGQLCLQQLGSAVLACLVFEGGRLWDSTSAVVVARKGMASYRVTVAGRGAHAGNNHHEGANAIVQLAATIGQIAALTDYRRRLTFNVGTITGGTVTNRVPHYAEAAVEMRAFEPEVFESGVAAMLALAEQATLRSASGDYPCKVQITLVRQTPPWPRNPATDSLLRCWQRAAADLGLLVMAEERGGLSDGNLIWQHIPTIDGLGPSGGNAHCSERSADGSKDQEYVLQSSLVPKTLLNVAAVVRLLGGEGTEKH